MPGIFSCSIIDLQARRKPLLEAVPSFGRSSLWWRKCNDFSWDDLKETVPNMSNIFIIGLQDIQSQTEASDSGLCISHYCWTWCEAQKVMELITASQKPKKLQARYIKSRPQIFTVFYFISCSQITFPQKKPQNRKKQLFFPPTPQMYVAGQ